MLVKKDDEPRKEETEKVPCLTEEGERCILPFLFSGKITHALTGCLEETIRGDYGVQQGWIHG